MKRLKVLIAAAGVFVSGVAAAELLGDATAIVFGNAPIGGSISSKIHFRNVGSNPIGNIIASISGNGSEFPVRADTCTFQTLFPAEECAISLSFTPLHYGSKRRKLTIDATEFLPDGTSNDVSLVVELIGTSDNPNKP